MVTMLGWFRRPAALISCWKRASYSSSSWRERFKLMVLIRSDAFGLAHVVDGDDVGVVQAPRGLDLLLEARLVLLELLAREIQVDGLDQIGRFRPCPRRRW